MPDDRYDHTPAPAAEPPASGGIPLLHAPPGVPVRILGISGGDGLRRRLLALGFHRGDIVRLDSHAILRGPVIIFNMATGARVALGRGVAHRILVEAAHARD